MFFCHEIVGSAALTLQDRQASNLFFARSKDALLLLGRELKFLYGPLNGGLTVRSLDLAYVLCLCADDIDAPGILFDQKSCLGRQPGSVASEWCTLLDLPVREFEVLHDLLGDGILFVVGECPPQATDTR